MKPRSYRRWKRRLAQLERLRGLANDHEFTTALDAAIRAAFKALPDVHAMPLDDVVPFFDPAMAGRGFYREVPPAQGYQRNRQLRRRR